MGGPEVLMRLCARLAAATAGMGSAAAGNSNGGMRLNAPVMPVSRGDGCGMERLSSSLDMDGCACCTEWMQHNG